MLAVLFIVSVFYQGDAEVSYGKEFVTAFPENIAYYYPFSSNNSLIITALYNNTHSQVSFNGSVLEDVTLDAGHIKVVYLPTEVELYQLNSPLPSVRITSDKDIAILSVSSRGDSVQTNVIPPSTNLAQEYQIPFPNYTQLILTMNTYNTSNSTDTSSLPPMYNFFRLIIINAEQKDNTIKVTQQQPSKSTNIEYKLHPFQFVQIQSNDSLVEVSGDANMSVLLTHPCLDTFSCRCNMIVHQIRPAYLQNNTFLVPPPYYDANYTRLFVTSENPVNLTHGSPLFGSKNESLNAGSSDFLAIFPYLANGHQNITTSQPISLNLILPGSMVELLPMSTFSACYLVHATSTIKSEALVIVNTSEVSRVHLDSGYFNSTVEWKILNGTEYSFAYIELKLFMSHVIWHPSSKIAVYVFERMSTGIVYGGLAISINEEPDPSGCVVTPAVINVGSEQMSWPKSHQYCLNISANLASPSLIEYQHQMALKLSEKGENGQAWIGLRRSLLTTEWYWQNNFHFSFTNWENGQPVDPQKGMCAYMSMTPGGNYTWSIARCCSKMRAMCYTAPKLLQLVSLVI